jgi:arylsulfatase A-like enzyme
MSQSNPNILLICSDQHRYDSIGANGNSTVYTPNLDKLAAGGINFTNAFTPCPICTPARASLLTGQWSFKHLNITIPNWTEAPRTHKPGLPTFPEVLKKKGYSLDYIGKWHLDYAGEMMPEQLGFDTYISEDEYFQWRSEMDIPQSELRKNWEQNIGAEEFDRLIRGGVDEHITPIESKLHWGANKVIDRLHARAKTDEPFFVRWDPSEPHLTNVLPEPYASMYDPLDVQPWGSFKETFHNKPYIQRQQLHSWGIHEWTWNDWAPIVARYYGEISLLDYELGRVLDALERFELTDNTIVIYTSDHGDMCGSHRMMDKHYVMYDDVTRVPLIINWSSVIKSNVHHGFVCNMIDLASTICELAGSAIPDTFQGMSLTPLLLGENFHPRNDIISAYHGAQFGLYTQRMIRDSQWKYIWNLTAEDELYDLENDPWELENKANNVQFQEILALKRKRLAEWLQETGDPILNVWTNNHLSYGRKL